MTATADATLIRGATIVTMDRQGDLHGYEDTAWRRGCLIRASPLSNSG